MCALTISNGDNLTNHWEQFDQGIRMERFLEMVHQQTMTIHREAVAIHEDTTTIRGQLGTIKRILSVQMKGRGDVTTIVERIAAFVSHCRLLLKTYEG